MVMHICNANSWVGTGFQPERWKRACSLENLVILGHTHRHWVSDRLTCCLWLTFAHMYSTQTCSTHCFYIYIVCIFYRLYIYRTYRCMCFVHSTLWGKATFGRFGAMTCLFVTPPFFWWPMGETGRFTIQGFIIWSTTHGHVYFSWFIMHLVSILCAKWFYGKSWENWLHPLELKEARIPILGEDQVPG